MIRETKFYKNGQKVITINSLPKRVTFNFNIPCPVISIVYNDDTIQNITFRDIISDITDDKLYLPNEIVSTVEHMMEIFERFCRIKTNLLDRVKLVDEFQYGFADPKIEKILTGHIFIIIDEVRLVLDNIFTHICKEVYSRSNIICKHIELAELNVTGVVIRTISRGNGNKNVLELLKYSPKELIPDEVIDNAN